MADGISVLIVEDDPMVAELNKRYVSKLSGFICAGVAHSAKDAMAVLAKQPVELILLDIYMPDTSGLEFLSMLRENHAETDVILLTAARDAATVQEALRLGAVDYLVKPFEFERLAQALQTYQRRRGATQADSLLDQEIIDRCLLNRSGSSAEPEHPKGLDKNTVEKMRAGLINLEVGQHFSADEIAQIVGVSRVTARRYLQYFTEQGILSKSYQYGAVGRPVCRYRLVKPIGKA